MPGLRIADFLNRKDDNNQNINVQVNDRESQIESLENSLLKGIINKKLRENNNRELMDILLDEIINKKLKNRKDINNIGFLIINDQENFNSLTLPFMLNYEVEDKQFTDITKMMIENKELFKRFVSNKKLSDREVDIIFNNLSDACKKDESKMELFCDVINNQKIDDFQVERMINMLIGKTDDQVMRISECLVSKQALEADKIDLIITLTKGNIGFDESILGNIIKHQRLNKNQIDDIIDHEKTKDQFLDVAKELIDRQNLDERQINEIIENTRDHYLFRKNILENLMERQHVDNKTKKLYDDLVKINNENIFDSQTRYNMFRQPR